MFLIDGYNLINADQQLAGLFETDLEAARETLIRALAEFSASRSEPVEVVFDAAGRPEPAASEERQPNLKVTFTAAGQSADAYIEAAAKGLKRGKTPPPQPSPLNGEGAVVVVTSDYEQQKIALGSGLLRMSSREFLGEMREARSEVKDAREAGAGGRGKVRLENRLPDEVRDSLIRLKNDLKR